MSAALPFVAAMELLKIVLVASYFFLPFDRTLPLFSYSAAFFASVALGVWLRSLGGRVAYRFLGHALAFTAAVLVLCGRYGDGQFALHRLLKYRGAVSLEFCILLFWIAVAWIRGVRLGASPASHGRTVTHFDIGLGVFVLLLGFGALVGVKNPIAERLILPYFLCGFASLSFSEREGYARGRRGGTSRAAILVAAVTAVASAVAATVAPTLMGTASRAGRIVSTAFSAAEPYLAAFLRFLFSAGAARRMEETTGVVGTRASGPIVHGESGFFAHILVSVFLWLLGAVLVFSLVLLASLALTRLWALLSRRTGGHARAVPSVLAYLAALARALAGSLAHLLLRIAPRGRRRNPALAAYARLLFWGRLFGLPRRATETPREYGDRAAAAFRRRAESIRSVVSAVELETYALPGYQRFSRMMESSTVD